MHLLFSLGFLLLSIFHNHIIEYRVSEICISVYLYVIRCLCFSILYSGLLEPNLQSPMLFCISFSICPSIVNVDPRYVHLSTVSSISPFIVITFEWLFENSFPTIILLSTDLLSLPYHMPLSSNIIVM